MIGTQDVVGWVLWPREYPPNIIVNIFLISPRLPETQCLLLKRSCEVDRSILMDIIGSKLAEDDWISFMLGNDCERYKRIKT